ncbi:ornithine decarboxylase-like [Cucurbita moschata]|uniref:ornithine decarboxylase n=1 Tax=Cucurbita moschata TaxID=3662 RepID=A0A6J1GJR9_CUCMO|nr:ornithine decarboxylase-like [Cucurbita moschata]
MTVEQLSPANAAETGGGIQSLQMAPGIDGRKITWLNKNGILGLVQSIIWSQKEAKEPFYILDLSLLINLLNHWARHLPMIQPYYAVKCNPNTAFLGAMAALGSSFDCASRAEIESILALGVSSDRIIFANPCKAESHIKYAASVGVNLTTFDSIAEVKKIRRCHPTCSLLIRIKAVEDSTSRSPLSSKYGALPNEIVPLLQAAQAAELDVVGVSFHIGSGGSDAGLYRIVIAAIKAVFDATVRLGMPRMKVLNIGGGFTAGPHFNGAVVAVKEAISEHFYKEEGLVIMAEPGRFFAEKCFTLAANIIGKRVRGDRREYWITDGIYGSMNCIVNDHAVVTCTPLATTSNPKNLTCQNADLYKSTVFGPTCDAFDTISTTYWLPDLEVDDWLLFPNMGAYTSATGSNFNGFATSSISTHLAYSDRL